jgi:hypothetical protein
MCQKTGGAELVSTPEGVCSASADITAAFDALVAGAYSNQNALSQANLFGQAVRVAFHDAGEAMMTNATDLMGADGCLSDTDENKGLKEASSLVVSVMDPIWQQHCDRISRADFWVLFARLAIKRADPTGTIVINFYFGRKDTMSCAAGAGRLPNAQLGRSEFQRFFVQDLGLTLAEGITLIGAHTLVCFYVHFLPPHHFNELLSNLPGSCEPWKFRLR